MSKKPKLFNDPIDAERSQPYPPSDRSDARNALWPGKPGYRTRPGRTGLDPLETSLESASLEGLFLKRLFTGKLTTRRKVYLWVMGIAGVLLLVPWALTLAAGGHFNDVASLVVCFSPFGAIGIGLLVNLGLNLKRSQPLDRHQAKRRG